MGFDVPNVSGLTYPFQARPFSTDYAILGASAGGFNGVVSGCAVTESGTPAMTVDVASGRVVCNGVGVDVTGETLAVSTADATHPRFDLVVAEWDGYLAIQVGTAAAAPVAPKPSGIALGTLVALAYIYVPANDSAIVDEQIVDKRITVAEPIGATPWTTIEATDQATSGTRSNTATLAADSQLTFAMAANTVYAIRAFVSILTAAGGSGAKVGFTGPASPTRVAIRGHWTALAPDITTVLSLTGRDFTSYDTTGVLTSGAASRTLRVVYEGVIHNGSNTGAFAITWAQQSAVAENTIRLNGSYLEYL